MILRTLIILVLTVSCQQVFSQGKIEGRVIDSLESRPIEYAVVSLLNSSDSNPINGVITDTTGRFNLDGIKDGSYYLKVELFGYHFKILKGISIQNGGSIDLGNIILTSLANVADTVVVKGDRKLTQIKLDKQVYKAAQFESSKGGTAIDVIKNMPSVTVSSEGEIRLRGSTGFLVLINGKPVLTDVNTVLSQIPANAVENIEIITSPTSKYDADGKSGIINITTKKGTDDGLSFIVNTQYGLPSLNDYNNLEKPKRYGADASLTYKKKNWKVSAGVSYQENDLAGRREGNVNTTFSNRYTSFPSIGERSFQRRNYALRTNVTYTPNKNNSFSVGFYVGQRRQYRRADINYDNVKTDVNNGSLLNRIAYFNSNLVKKQGDFSLINIDYSHTFKNKSTITFSGLYEHALLDGYTKNLNTGLNRHTDTMDYVLNTGNSPLDGIRGKVDYTIPIGKGKLEGGYQIRYQKQTGEFLYQDAILGTVQYSIRPEFSANIDVVNQIHGVYTQYSGKLNKLEYTGGLRYEYASRVFDADKLSIPYTLYLSNIFPSANLLYSIKPDLKIKGGYSKRVQRSTSNELNPYPEREHSETLEQGDPQIKPEFVNLSEIGVVKDFKKNGNVFITLYNQRIDNVVNRVNSAYNDSIINRIYTNAGRATLWGIETGINIKPVKWWTFYAGANIYDYHIKGSLFNNVVAVNNSRVAYSINTNQTFQLAKSLSLIFNLNYLSLRPTAQGEDSRFISPNLSVKKTFLNGKLTAVLQWQNIGLGIIKSNEQRITTWGSNFYTTTNYIQEKDVLWINISYSFKQTSKKTKLPASEFGEREF